MADNRCLICRRDIPPEQWKFSATRKTDGGLVCPECLEKVRIGHTDTLRTLSESAAVW